MIVKKQQINIYAQNELLKTRCYKSIEEFKKKALSLIDIETEFDYHGNFLDKINWEEIFNYFAYDEMFEDDEGIFLVSNAKELLKLFEAEDDSIYLPNFQIDRELYKECKAIVESYGYTYKSKKFTKKESNAKDDLQKMIDGVEVLSARKKFDFFPTPEKIVNVAQELLEHDGESYILEPSCGLGNLVKNLEKFTKAIEINEDCISELKAKGIEVIGSDFTKETPKRFKYIIMNPPFGKRNDCKHSCLAFNNWLSDGGTLVTITSGNIMNVNDKYGKEFQELYNKYGVYQEEIQGGEFKESGTNISTMIHKFIKPEKDEQQLTLF